MDEDVMTRSSYGKIIFNSVNWTPKHLVCQFYPKYIYEEVKTTALCTIGLYVIPKNDPEDFVIKQELFIVLQTLGEDIRLNFERSKLPVDRTGFYIFQFMNDKGEVMGASTPFKLQSLPSSKTLNEESDDFVVIREDSRRASMETISSPLPVPNMNSFVVLSEQFSSVMLDSIQGKTNPTLMSDSMFSMVNDHGESNMQMSTRSECLPSLQHEFESLSTLPQDCPEMGESLKQVVTTEELAQVKNELEIANSKLEEKNNRISLLEDELALKNERMNELEKKLKDRDNSSTKSYEVQEFQTLHKSDQLKIYQLEMEIKTLEKEMKQLSTSSHFELEDIKKSIHELQNSVKVERPKSPEPASSFDNLDSLLIKEAIDSSVSTEKSSSKAEVSLSSVSTTTSSQAKSTPRILDDGKVIIGNECPICAQKFDESDTVSFSVHINNHFPSKPNSCPICEKVFDADQKSLLEDHVNSHFDSDDYDEINPIHNKESEEEEDGRLSTIRSVLNFINSL